ncbi:MAG: AMP-binding protein, partial [Candidatus Binatota bacterium]|nr:AMP-binding protein [Candidatus Binatota bacterium]
MQDTYDTVYTRWLNDPENFWAEAAEAVHWDKKWDRVLDDSRPPFYKWFPGGLLNTCYNALDRHVEGGRGNQPALIYDSPVTGVVQTFTYRELLDQVASFAGVLAGQKVQKGDRVIIYMPMVPEAIVAMLACARIGAIHSVVFGGFAAAELANRITDARPKIIISATCGIEAGRIIPYKPLLDKAIDLAAVKPERCIIVQRPQAKASMIGGRDLDWSEAMADAK